MPTFAKYLKIIIIMKKLIVMLVSACLICSCGGKQDGNNNQEESKSEQAKGGDAKASGTTIDTEMLKVKLKDTRTQMEQRLKESGANLEVVNDGMFVKADTKTDFGGVTFDGVTYVMDGDKVNLITLSKVYYDKAAATKDYNSLIDNTNKKYGNIRADGSNDEEMTFTQYKDSSTDFSIFLIHHSKEDMQNEAQNDKEKAAARENWEIDVTYESLGK